MYKEFYSFSPHIFYCPSCKEEFVDEKEFYLRRCNRILNRTTRVACKCKTFFYLSIDYTGKFKTYVLK